MSKARDSALLQQIHTLFNVGTLGGLTDGQFLERFTACNGEVAELAFAALVERHGPMVLRVCLSVLREPNDAQDAFQATFLVFSARAGSIRKRDSLSSWLHGVARRIAACAKAAAARRRKYERRAAERAVISVDGGVQDEVALALHEELGRLPEKNRTPIILCYLEGLSHEQAAQQLRWPVGTVRSRLARGRERLRGRLVRRGLALSAGLLEGALSAEAAPVAIRASLVSVTAEAAVGCASSRLFTTRVISESVSLLVEGAIRAMFVTRMKLAVLACGLIGTGAFVAVQQVRSAPQAQARTVQGEVTERHADRSAAIVADDVAVAREMRRMDLDLLAEDVQRLRDQVEIKLRDKLQAERRNSGGTGEGPGNRANEAEEARIAYESARASIWPGLASSRASGRHLGGAQEARQAGTERSLPPPNDGLVRNMEPGKAAPTSSAAAIGSISMDAVMERYEKAREAREQFRADSDAERKRLAKLQIEIEKLTSRTEGLLAGSPDLSSLIDQISALKAKYETERERLTREFAEREARTMAGILKDIQEVVTSVARAKGLNYVVEVSPSPPTGADMVSALKRARSSTPILGTTSLRKSSAI